jgi:hypothetical protein
MIDDLDDVSDGWQAGNRISVEQENSERSPNIHQRSSRLKSIVIHEFDIINSRTIKIEDGEGDATLSMERRDVLFTTSL